MLNPHSSRFAAFSPREARRVAVALTVLLTAGLVSSCLWEPVVARLSLSCSEGLHGALSINYELYRDVTNDVRDGANYYDAAYVHLKRMGGRIGSIFNWRLPTYAWLAALVPGDRGLQVAVVGLSIFALGLAFAAERREQGTLRALVLMVLLAAVLRWSFDGLAFYAQELWVAVLLTISLSATSLADRTREHPAKSHNADVGWSVLAVGSGLLALLCRELALPYCLAAGGIAWWYGRRGEAVAWLIGIGLFFALLAWHGYEVHARLTAEESATSRGASEWIAVGGMGTLLMTARMNSFQYVAPNWLMVAYVFASLVGLADSPRRHCTLAGLTALLYLAAFCVVGLDVNFYWGLMYAPLLPFGLIRFPQAAGQLLNRIRAPLPNRADL